MKIWYLLDHFSGSDELYHEMYMHFSDLPRSYLVWAYRSILNENVMLEELPGEHNGARIPLIPMLTADLCRVMSKEKAETPSGRKYSIKISGDSARFSRTSNFMLLSYVI